MVSSFRLSLLSSAVFSPYYIVGFFWLDVLDIRPAQFVSLSSPVTSRFSKSFSARMINNCTDFYVQFLYLILVFNFAALPEIELWFNSFQSFKLHSVFFFSAFNSWGLKSNVKSHTINKPQQLIMKHVETNRADLWLMEEFIDNNMMKFDMMILFYA